MKAAHDAFHGTGMVVLDERPGDPEFSELILPMRLQKESPFVSKYLRLEDDDPIQVCRDDCDAQTTSL